MRHICTLWLILLLLSSCSSHDRATISISQTRVMEPSLLAAGIITDKPHMTTVRGRQRASSLLYNQQEQAVTLHYRFFWYDYQGLEIRSFAAARTVTVPAHGRVEISSFTDDLTASQIRLYLWL